MDGKKLRDKMTEKKMTQKMLGDRVGVSQQMITRIVTGSKQPSLALAKEIANVLGCTVDELLS